ncbi:CHAD domain-containing protein [Kaarinaea lacus]
MHTPSTEFILPVSLAFGKVKSILKQKLNYTDQPGEHLEISCLDSFDWRLFRKGVALDAVEQDKSTQLFLRRLNSGECLYSENVNGEVDFPWKLPDGDLKNQLCKILKMRALIPQVYLLVKRQHLAGLNTDQKTVSRIMLDEYQVYDPDTDSYRRLEKRIQVIPVRGYANPHRRALEFIKREWSLDKADKEILITALNALDRQPADYSIKSHIELTPDMRCDVATKILLREMLDIMEANEWGICDDVDSEFLHDYRVAIRKTRSAFKQVKGIFPEQDLEKHQSNFTWLGTITSPARDMDVYLLKFEDYRSMLPAELRDHIDPLYKLLDKKKRQAYRSLIRTLSSQRYQTFMTAYRAFLDASLPQDAKLANAERPVKAVADERIWKVYRRLMKEGIAIKDNSPAEDLHELRITCKKLRYLIELFQSLYKPKLIKQLVGDMKKLQDNLGAYNDLHVQSEKLKELSVELEKQKFFTRDTGDAMAALVEHLEELQFKERAKFARQFEKFSDKAVKREFRQLFRSEQ